MTAQDPTGLSYLDDDELRRHVRIMLEGTGRRGPQAWALDNLDDDIYREIERRVPLCAALRAEQDELLAADLRRRMAADPTAAEVDEYADSGRSWADQDAERAWENARDRWRAAMTGWLGKG